MKILTIGDIHGRDCWKKIIFGSDLNFQNWCQYPFSRKEIPYDKVIFIGDYVDSLNVGGPEILLNLKDILKFKANEPEKVVLLFGNNDWQYIANKQYTGYDMSMSFDYRTIFLDNLVNFDLAHYMNINGRDVIWSHAGITVSWLYEFFLTKKKNLIV